jgi:signal transduction histidine kinase
MAQLPPAGWQADARLHGVALRTLAQAPGGLLWLATDDGVYRYDGIDLVPLNALRRSGPPLPAVACNHLLALPGGELWLGTEAGAFRFTAAGALQPLVLPVPGSAWRVVDKLMLSADGRRVWLAQERSGIQAYTLAGKPTGPLIPAVETRRGMWAAPDGTLWLLLDAGHTQRRAATGRILNEWHHPRQYLLPTVDRAGQVSLLSARAAYRPGPQGQLPETGRWSSAGPEGPFDIVRSDTSATLLTHDRLVHVVWTRQGQPRAQFTLAPLPWQPTTWGACLRVDAAGQWWLYNTGFRGCWRRSASPAFIQALAGPGGKPYSVRASARLPDGRLLVSAYGAGVLTQAADSPLAPLRPLRTAVAPHESPPVLMGIVPAHLGPAGEWLTGTRNSFLALNPRSGRMRELPVQGAGEGIADVRSLGRDPATGQVWGGTGSGLYAFDSVAQTFRPYWPGGVARRGHPPLAGRTIEDLWADGRGHLWLATPEGVVRLTLATGARRAYGPTEATPRRVAADGARCLYGDDAGRVWVGTRTHGLLVVEPDGRAHSVLTPDQGLPHASVATIIRGSLGALWLGTYQGLVRYQPKNGALAVYTTADGLASDECNSRAAMGDTDGSLLIGGVAGLHRVYPRQVPAIRSVRPRLLVVALTPVAASAPASRTRYLLPTDSLPTLHLGPDQPQIELHLALSGYIDVANARYAYRVPGWLGGRWLALGNTPRLRLQGLPPGRYEVEVRGETSWGRAAANHLRLPLTVTVEWWRRPLVWGLGALLAVAAVYGWQRHRLRLARADARRRARLAADLHDEVGALLTRVTLQADLLRELPPAAMPARLAALREDSQAAADTVRDIIWSVSPEADTLAGLLARMHDVLDQTARAGGLETELRTENWPADPSAVALVPDVRQHLYLVYKEAITNVLRHAPGATRVVVALRYLSGSRLALTVSNDGPLAAPAASRSSQGLRNMRQRAAALGWQLSVGPAPDGGWVVQLKP